MIVFLTTPGYAGTHETLMKPGTGVSFNCGDVIRQLSCIIGGVPLGAGRAVLFVYPPNHSNGSFWPKVQLGHEIRYFH